MIIRKILQLLKNHILSTVSIIVFIVLLLGIHQGRFEEFLVKVRSTYIDCLRLHGYEFPYLSFAGLTGDIVEDDKSGKLDEFVNAVQSRYKHIMELEGVTSCGVPRTISFVCKDDDLCGGLGDRIQGVLSTFYLALLTDSQFKIEWTKPLLLQEFIVPNSNGIDWISTRISMDKGKTSVLNYGDTDSSAVIEDSYSMNFLEQWKRFEKINVHSNQAFWVRLTKNNTWGSEAGKQYQLHQLPASYLYTIAARILLTTPSNKLLPYINNVTQQWDAREVYKIGLHMRTGGEGVWNDPKRVNIEVAVRCFVAEAVSLYEKYVQEHSTPLKPIFFVATDSQSAIQLLHQEFQKLQYDLYFNQGNITHLDRDSAGKLFQDNVRTYSDWFILQQMDALVITRSGFSETVAAMTLKPTRRYISGSECKFIDFAEKLNADDWYPRYNPVDATDLGRISD
ncbi:hypothetical protein K7432_008598 [Basidiobolus ranarum]|uniref:Uncharacterized protein n=1 Tax=Basidiobolus ranarum TaxID=34480 RepID=A0ABR2VYC8_9FUNG